MGHDRIIHLDKTHRLSRSWMWLIALVGIVVACAFSLHHRANPWERVWERPSGVNPDDYDGYHLSHLPSAGDLTSDGRRLALGRPDGNCEIWELDAAPKLLRTVLPPLPIDPDPDAMPGLSVQAIHWLADNQHLAVCRGDAAWEFLHANGNIISVPEVLEFTRVSSATSPTHSLIAIEVATGLVKIVDGTNGQTVRKWRLEHINGSRTRLEWSRDGRFLLWNDYLGVRVWDMNRDWEMVVFHRELDWSLPPPMIADEHSGITAFEKARPSIFSRIANSPVTPPTTNPTATSAPPAISALADSRFSPDGSYFATAYESMIGNRAGTRQLRLYDSAAGNLLWELALTQDPRMMEFSQDGSRLFVLCGANSSIQAFVDVIDPIQKARVGRLDLADSPSKLSALSRNRVVATGRTAWIVGGDNQFAPIKLESIGATAAVLQTPDGNGLILVGREMSAQYYRQRRSESRLGAFALPETWLIHVASITGIFLLLRLICLRGPIQPPRSLHLAVMLGGVVASLGVSAGIIETLISDVHRMPVTFNWWSIVPGIISAVLLAGAIGTAAMKRFWWLFYMTSVLIMAAAGGIFLARFVARISSDMGSLVYHGIRFESAATVAVVTYALSLIHCAASLILLMRPETRDAFPGRADLSHRRGFAVETKVLLPEQVDEV